MFTNSLGCSFRFSFLYFLAGFNAVSYAQTIMGKMFDAGTGDPLAGPSLNLRETNYYIIVRPYGSYSIKNGKLGSYQMENTLIGYKNPKLAEVIVADKDISKAEFVK